MFEGDTTAVYGQIPTAPFQKPEAATRYQFKSSDTSFASVILIYPTKIEYWWLGLKDGVLFPYVKVSETRLAT